jgi:ribosomal subunit interface protein
MHAYLTARHFELTDRIRSHVQRHIFHAVEAHADARDLNRVEVQLSMGQREERFTCHAMIQLPGQREVNVTEHHHDLFAAIDLAEKRLVRALTDLRQRQHTTHRHPRKYSQEKVARILRSTT